MNMGGPDSLSSIRPFLFRLLNDPDVVHFPVRWLQWAFALGISILRSGKVRGDYERLGGGSPQLPAVRAQAAALQESLGPDFECVPVFRYWGEGAREARSKLQPGQPVVLMSLYPHACGATTVSSIRDARRALKGHDGAITEVASYPDHVGFVAAILETILETLASLPQGAVAEVVFSAHSTPEVWVEQGDPYLGEIQRTVIAVTAGQQWRTHLCFQSRVGVTKWLGPSTLETVARLGADGCDHLVLVPIAFTSDHIETLIELDEQVRDVALQAGVQNFHRVPCLNDRPAYIQALRDLAIEAIR
jgi:ferrochelatase